MNRPEEPPAAARVRAPAPLREPEERPEQAPELRPWLLVEDLMRTGVIPLTPADQLDRALELFIENDLMALPIVNDARQRQVIGMVRRSDVGAAYLRRVHGSRLSDEASAPP